VANEVALEERNSITVELHQLGLLTQIDMATLASYCMSFARWIEAEALVQKLGVMLAEPTLGPDGEEMGMRYKRNHATIISRDGRMAMCRYSSMFGFDPSSRTRICSPCGCVSACIDRIYHRFDCCAVWHRQSSRNDHGDHQ
jgi:P27 family predicted phage terminase small subunit